MALNELFALLFALTGVCADIERVTQGCIARQEEGEFEERREKKLGLKEEMERATYIRPWPYMSLLPGLSLEQS